MLSALEIATQGFAPRVTLLVALQGFGAATGATVPVAGGYGSSAARARRYLVKRRGVLMSFSRREDADEAARQVAAELAAAKPRARRRAGPDAAAVQVAALPEVLPESLDISAALTLAAEQGMADAFRRAMQASQYAQMLALYLQAVQAAEDEDVELLLLSLH